MDGPSEIYLHLGAHRTGTSSLQLLIDDNATLLRDRGYDLAWPGRDGAPHGKLSLKLPMPDLGDEANADRIRRARRHLGRFVTGRRSLLISEENMLGGMQGLGRGRLYPALRLRLDAVRQILPPAPVHALIVLRPFDQLFNSWYRMRASEQPVPPLREAILPHLLASDRWSDVVAQILELLNPVRFTVVDYDSRGESRSLLARLLPDIAAADLTEPGVRLNQSPSDAVLMDVQRRLHGEAGTWDDIDPESFLAPPSTGEQKLLRNRYQADLIRIARMPGVTLVR